MNLLAITKQLASVRPKVSERLVAKEPGSSSDWQIGTIARCVIRVSAHGINCQVYSCRILLALFCVGDMFGVIQTYVCRVVSWWIRPCASVNK